MSLADVQKLTIEMMVADVPASIGLHYKRQSGGMAGDPCIDLVNAFVANMMPPLLAILSSSTQVMRVMARCLTPAEGNPYEANFTETNVGTEGAEALAPSLALLLKVQCASLSSRNNGHLYIPGVPESRWVNGAWEAATYVPKVTTLRNTWNAPIPISAAGVVYNMVIVSRYLNLVKRVPPITYDMVDLYLVDRISQQRRRQSGMQGIKS